MDFFKKKRVSNSVLSALLIAIGVFLILYPDETKIIVCYTLGGLLALVGIVKFIAFGLTQKRYRDNDDIAECMIWVIFGAVLVIRSDILITLYPILVGLTIIMKNAFKLSECIGYRKAGINKLWADIILIVIMIGLGLTLCLLDPSPKTNLMAYLTGATLILDGLVSLLLFFMLLNVSKQAKEVEEDVHNIDNTNNVKVVKQENNNSLLPIRRNRNTK